MARKARQTSGTGIYHVMLRGINRQVIFESNADYSCTKLGFYIVWYIQWMKADIRNHRYTQSMRAQSSSYLCTRL